VVVVEQEILMVLLALAVQAAVVRVVKMSELNLEQPLELLTQAAVAVALGTLEHQEQQAVQELLLLVT